MNFKQMEGRLIKTKGEGREESRKRDKGRTMKGEKEGAEKVDVNIKIKQEDDYFLDRVSHCTFFPTNIYFFSP